MRFFKTITIAQRLWVWAGLAGALFFVSVWLGWSGLLQARESLRVVYEERLEALRGFEAIQQHLEENRRLVLLAFQLNPEGGFQTAHDRPMSHYLDEIDRNSAAIEEWIGTYSERPHGEEEKRLLEKFNARYAEWRAQLDEVMASLRIEEFRLTDMLAFIQAGEPAGDKANNAIDALHAFQVEVTGNDYAQAEARFRRTVAIYIALSIIGIVAGAVTSVSLIRRISLALRTASEVARSIAKGDLAQPVPSLGSDEMGQLLGDIGQMRDSLHSLVT